MRSHAKKALTTLLSLDRQYLAAGLFSMGSSQTAGVVIALITSYFFANYIDKGVYGSYQFVLTVLGIMSIFTLRGVGKQIVREYVQSGKAILVPKTLQFIVYAIPVSGIGLIAALYFYTKENPSLALAIAVISVFFPLLNSLPLYSAFLLAKQKFAKQAIAMTIQMAIPAIALVTAILNGAGLVSLVLVYAASHTLTLLSLYAYTVWSEQVSFVEKTARTSVEFHLSFGQSILEIGKIADRLLVFSFLGTTVFASYMIALLPVREMMRLPQVIRELVLPKFSKYSYEQVKAQAFEKTAILFLLFTLITVVYIVIAPYAFSIIFPLYPESVFYTQVLAILFPFTSSLVLVQMLTVFDKTRALYIVNTSFAAVTIVTLVVFTYYFGLMGAICSRLFSTIFRFIMLTYYSTKS